MTREVHLDCRALPYFAVYFDIPARLFDEAVDLTQAEAGAAAEFFGRVERLESVRERFRRHPAARVRHADHDILPGRDLGIATVIAVVHEGVRRFDGKLATLRHRIPRVDRKIDKRRLELGRVSFDLP